MALLRSQGNYGVLTIVVKSVVSSICSDPESSDLDGNSEVKVLMFIVILQLCEK